MSTRCIETEQDLTITQRLSPPLDEAIEKFFYKPQAYSNLFPNSFKLVFNCFRMKYPPITFSISLISSL